MPFYKSGWGYCESVLADCHWSLAIVFIVVAEYSVEMNKCKLSAVLSPHVIITWMGYKQDLQAFHSMQYWPHTALRVPSGAEICSDYKPV